MTVFQKEKDFLANLNDKKINTSDNSLLVIDDEFSKLTSQITTSFIICSTHILQKIQYVMLLWKLLNTDKLCNRPEKMVFMVNTGWWVESYLSMISSELSRVSEHGQKWVIKSIWAWSAVSYQEYLSIISNELSRVSEHNQQWVIKSIWTWSEVGYREYLSMISSELSRVSEHNQQWVIKSIWT
jgi:hypothetical protein